MEHKELVFKDDTLATGVISGYRLSDEAMEQLRLSLIGVNVFRGEADPLDRKVSSLAGVVTHVNGDEITVSLSVRADWVEGLIPRLDIFGVVEDIEGERIVSAVKVTRCVNLLEIDVSGKWECPHCGEEHPMSPLVIIGSNVYKGHAQYCGKCAPKPPC